MKLFKLISEYRWPIYVGGHLTMSVVACGVLVWVATRPDSPRPIKGYYEAARAWDADEAVEAASQQLGWSVHYELPTDIPHFAGMPRPLDVRITNRQGGPVRGLTGRIFAIRASDARLNQSGQLVEIPQSAGSYRTLIRLDEPGVWELRLDTAQAALRFVHATRFTVSAEASPDGGTSR